MEKEKEEEEGEEKKVEEEAKVCEGRWILRTMESCMAVAVVCAWWEWKGKCEEGRGLDKRQLMGPLPSCHQAYAYFPLCSFIPGGYTTFEPRRWRGVSMVCAVTQHGCSV